MKYITTYNIMNLNNKENVFNYIISTLKETIHNYDFFVDWEKVLENSSRIEIALNILNSLIGKDDIEKRFALLIKNYPEVVKVIPILIAIRDTKVKISELKNTIDYSFLEQSIYTDEEIRKIIYFAKRCGLLKILQDKSIKDLVDYVIGVEVGLDSNARKNRSGFAMENLTEFYIKDICEKYNYKYIAQATAAKIKKEFGKDVNTDKANRHFDFAVDTGDMLYLIEVNYYSGGGSKLKSVAGEFSTLFDLVSNAKTSFIWITDGKGWLTAQKPLKETFNHIDYIMNINMIQQGLLADIITKGL